MLPPHPNPKRVPKYPGTDQYPNPPTRFPESNAVSVPPIDDINEKNHLSTFILHLSIICLSFQVSFLHLTPFWFLADVAEQLGLEDELALLVLFAGFVGLVVLPTDCFVALTASDVADNVPACRHVTFARLASRHVHDTVEQIRLAVLAAEVPADYVLMVGQMRLAVPAPVDLATIKIGVVCETHGCC